MNAAARLLASAAVLAAAGCATTSPRTDPRGLYLIADRSRDGRVSITEFIGFSIAELFSRTDRHRDGFVTLEEFTAAGGDPATFREADRSGTGRISVNDAQRAPSLQERMASLFRRADNSRDNYLDKAEFDAQRAGAPASLR